MKVGPGLFGADDLIVTTSEGHRIAKSLFRLNVLLHEARHGDGNTPAGTLSFAHALCPNDESIPEEIRGLPACGQAMASLLELCDGKCSERDRGTLQAVELDTISRLLIDDLPENHGDGTPENPITAVETQDFERVTTSN